MKLAVFDLVCRGLHRHCHSAANFKEFGEIAVAVDERGVSFCSGRDHKPAKRYVYLLIADNECQTLACLCTFVWSCQQFPMTSSKLIQKSVEPRLTVMLSVET